MDNKYGTNYGTSPLKQQWTIIADKKAMGLTMEFHCGNIWKIIVENTMQLTIEFHYGKQQWTNTMELTMECHNGK